MGRTRVELDRDLDQVVAVRVALPAAERLTERVQRAAQRLAPPAKLWVTAHDERVRYSHREADAQMIPANLRYLLPAVVYVRKGRNEHGKAMNPEGGWKPVPGRHDLARAPRDPELPIEQRINCRCASFELPGALARTIFTTPAVLRGAAAVAQVYTRFPRAAESETGTSRDRGAHFMAGALREVAAGMRR